MLIFTHQGVYWVDGMPLDYRTEYPLKVRDCIDETKRLINGSFAYPIEELADMMCGAQFFRRFYKEMDFGITDEHYSEVFDGILKNL